MLGRYRQALKSLQEVVLSATVFENPSTFYSSEGHPFPKSKSYWGELWNTVFRWNAFGLELYIGTVRDLINRKFDLKKAGGPLRGWNTVRRINYDSRDGRVWVRELQMVFRKQGMTPPPAADGWVELGWR